MRTPRRALGLATSAPPRVSTILSSGGRASRLAWIAAVVALLVSACTTGKSSVINSTTQAPQSTSSSDLETSSTSTHNGSTNNNTADTPTTVTGDTRAGDSGTTLPETSSEPSIEPRVCEPNLPDDFRPNKALGLGLSIELSEAAFVCANEVGIAPPLDNAAATRLLAQEIDGPLLLANSLTGAALHAELSRLEPIQVFTAGYGDLDTQDALNGYQAEDLAVVDLAASPSQPEIDSETEFARWWLSDNPTQANAMRFLAHQFGVGVAAAGGDLRALPLNQRNGLANALQIDLLFEPTEEELWQLEVVKKGAEIPGGGLLMFGPEAPRRLVAMYGHPTTRSLGVLGEQGADEAASRLAEISIGYDADGSTVLPTLEIIATIASAGAGRDGNYSNETAREVIRPWIEIATANDFYVVLDLQPGRTHFLSQAKIYEEFLRLPNVGLALDPEWRLKPHQVHLRQIGTVDAAEVNEVVDWLAGIVREEALPQKLLILHQFRFSMITNRSTVKTPPELAVLVQMDGQGRLPSKYNTWNALTTRPDAGQFYWGWKNFYDEDSPVATPEEVLALSPTPFFVSFQ